MGVRDWRAKRSMKDPVRGQFRVTGQYFAHPNGNSFREMLTGVLTGPGIAATAGEHLADSDGRYIGHDTLPALIDRANPTTFTLLWDEIDKPDFRAQARDQAAQAGAAQAAAAQAAAAQAAASGGGNYAYPPPMTPTASSAPAAGGIGTSEEGSPEWATALLADLARQGLLPAGAGADAASVTINLPTQIMDLTAGHLSAADAAELTRTGEPATAVLTDISDVAVPREALPGPTASLCDLSLTVTRQDGQTYAATTRLGFRDADRRARIAVTGTTLPVRVDPADPTRVVVDVPLIAGQQSNG